jgi:hypothetical protein
MKRFVWVGVVVCLALIPCAKAQEDGTFQAGAFVDYYRAGATGTNMFGLGGRFGVGVTDSVTVEGEMAYDFNRAFVNSFTQVSGGSVSFIESNVRTLHGFVGPRMTIGQWPIRPFVELKLGFVNYSFGPLALGYTSFASQVANLRAQNVNAALLPGAGLEGKFVGPVSVRLDVGDEMYFNHGAHSGLKVMLGPYIRF